MGFIHLQIEWNPWLGGYRPQIPVLSALYPQLNLSNPPGKKLPGTLQIHIPPPTTDALFPIVTVAKYAAKQ
jgi:hypothetical protein